MTFKRVAHTVASSWLFVTIACGWTIWVKYFLLTEKVSLLYC